MSKPRMRRVLPWVAFVVAATASATVFRLRDKRFERTSTVEPPKEALLPTEHAAPTVHRGSSASVRYGPGFVVGEQPLSGPAPTPQFKVRAVSEWQGLLIDTAVAPTCDKTEHCSRAQVCRSERCLPCGSDAECLRGELCVLDHCVKRALVDCRRAEDCGGTLCILSDYSGDGRGNAEMRAYCAAPDAEAAIVKEAEPVPEPIDNRPPALGDRLREKIERSFDEEL